MSPEKRPSGGQPEMPDMSGSFEDFLARIEEKQAKRAPDGAFAEYRGQVAYSIIEQVMPLALDAAPAAIENIIETMPWGTPQADRQVSAHVYSASSIFNRALLACLDEPTAEQSVRTFTWLTTQAQGLPTDIARRTPEEQHIWYQKINLFGLACLGVKQKEHFEQRAFGETTTTPEAQSVIEALENHVAQVRESIMTLDGSDTATVMRLLDVEAADTEELSASIRAGRSKTKLLRKGRHIPEGLYEIMSEASSSAHSEWDMVTLYSELWEPLETKWKECEVLCSWEQVNRTLAMLPELHSTDMRVRAADALEDMSEVQLAGVLAGEDFPAESLAELIHYDIYANTPRGALPYQIYAEQEDVPIELTYADVSLPRDMAPAASVALLGDIAECNTAEEFEAILLRAQEAILDKSRRSPTTLNEWLLTLALLRKSGGGIVRERTDAFIARDDFPHPTFKEVIANERPGRIYLMPNGKIRVADNLSGACCLETSSATPKEPEAPAKQLGTASPDGHQNVSREKGPQVAPGKQLSRRRRKDARHAGTVVSDVVNQPTERQRPGIVLPPGSNLGSLANQISPADLALVVQTISENQTHGRHPMVPLRGRAADGSMLCKLRVNGIGGGIRVILMHVGHNQFEIQTIQYRGGAYKNLPRGGS